MVSHVDGLAGPQGGSAESGAETARRLAEERFHAIVGVAPVGISYVDRDGHYLLANDALCRMLGRTTDEMATLRFHDITHPDDLELDTANVARLAAGEADRYSIEKRYLHANGDEIWVNLTVSVVRQPNGQPAYYVAVIEDIRDRHAAAERIQQGERFVRRLLDRLPVAIGVLTPDGVVQEINRAPLRRSRLEPDDVRGTLLWDIRWWSGRPIERQLVRAAVERAAKGEFVRFDVETQIRDDTRIWLDMQFAPLRVDGDEVTHVVVSASDITERVHTARRLQESEARFRLMADDSPIMIWVHDAWGNQEFVNRTFCEYFGVERDEMVGDRWMLLTHPDDGSHYVDTYLAAVEHQSTFRAETRVRRADGAWRWVESLGQPRFAPDGRFLGHVGTSIDVTDRREAADMLRRAAAAEHHVALELQQALLPRDLASTASVTVAGLYEPADLMLQVGGDWYDSIELDDGRVVLVVGDVVGHGLEAAAIMGRLRSGFAALTGPDVRPGELLMAFDRFARRPGGTDFATLCCAVLDPCSGSLQYASAGHPPMLVVADDGSCRWLEGGRSMPIAVAETGLERGEASTVLRPGDTLVLYSDGLIERRHRHIDEGLELLRRSARRLATPDNDLFCTSLMRAMLDESAAEDDAVLVTARFEPSTVHHVQVPADMAGLRLVRAGVRAWLHRNGVARDRAADILLAVSEASSNVVEHAYAGRAVGPLAVRVERDADDVLVTVADEGSWRADHPTNGGRGTSVMQRLSDAFERSTGDHGSVVSMRFRVPAAT